MRRKWLSRRAGACILLGLLSVAAPPTHAASSSNEAVLLAEANRRWEGARCRSLQEIWLKKGAAEDGWSKSKWLFWDESKGNSRLRVWFEDGDAIYRAFVNGVVPGGTEFTAIGWREEKPGGNLFLELEQVDTGVGVKVYFWDDWVGRVSAKRVPDFEQWARMEFFEVKAADEVLVDASAPATVEATGSSALSSTSPSNPTGAPLPVPPGSERASVELRVLGVAVDPLRITPGGEIALVITYTVEGFAAGREVEVHERRILLSEGRELTTLEVKIPRQTGTFESRQTLRIPADLAPAIYELRAAIEANGTVAEGSAIFQVAAPGN